VSRQPPNDIQAEQSVVGACLLSREALDEAVGVIQAADFYVDRHRHLWEVLLELREEGTPIDVVTLVSALQERGRLGAVGGRKYLADVARAVPTAANVVHYAKVVRDLAFRRRLYDAGSRIARLTWADGEVGDLANEAERIAREATTGVLGGDRLEPMGRILTDRWQWLYETRHEADLLGLRTGFPAIDGILGGLMPSDLLILGARPSMGKTALALSIMLNVARAGRTVALFSLEMSAAQIADRVVCMTQGLDSHAVRTRRLGEHEWELAIEAAVRLGALPIHIDDEPKQRSAAIGAKARRIPDLALVVIDFLQLVADERLPGQTRNEQIGEIVDQFKAMARDLDVPVLCLSQLSRACELRLDKRPQLADLRDSGNIEQTADVVMLLYRPAYYDPKDSPGVAELNIAKHRNGPTGPVKLHFDARTTRFGNLETRREEPWQQTAMTSA